VVGGVAASVGEDQTGAAVQRGVGGAHGVATGGNVVHEVNLSVTEAPKRSFEGVLLGRGGGQVAAVAGALGFDWAGAADGLGNLSAGHVAGDVGGQDGVGAGAAGAVGDGDKPARGCDERGHFASGGLEVADGAAGVFDGVGEAAGLGIGLRKRAVAGVGVFAGGEDFHGAMPGPLRQSGEGGRWG